jgi:hypothetical protein
MNKILIILSLVFLASCGPSAEEKRQVEMEQQRIEMEQQRIEQEASEKLAQEKAIRIAAVTCSIMSETRNMDAAIRVREMNDAREKIGGEPFLRGDSAIQEAFEWGLCQELVLNESYDETLQPLKDANRERERIAAEKQRILAEKQRLADSKPSVKEEFHPNGKLESRTNYQPKSDGGEKHGLSEDYYENGQLKYRRNFKDGEVDGPFESYHDNGQLRSEGNFKDGKADGLYKEYDRDGQLQTRNCYKNGGTFGVDMSYCEK